MALQATAVKGGITISEAYIIITQIKMMKYLRPTLDADKKFAGNVVSVQHSARVEIYSSKLERDLDFGSSPFGVFMTFEHAPGADMMEEAYAAVLAKGIEGWGLSSIKTV